MGRSGSGRSRALAAVVVAVPDLDAAIEAYGKLGFAVRDRSLREGWGIEAAILEVDRGIFELIAPTDRSLPVGAAVTRFLEKRGPGLYMASLEVDDIESEYEALTAAGVPPPAPPVDAPGDAGIPARLLWPALDQTEGAMLEFIEFAGG